VPNSELDYCISALCSGCSISRDTLTITLKHAADGGHLYPVLKNLLRQTYLSILA